MGKVYLGVPPELALRIKNAFGLDTFIETGTYKGGTSSWAAGHFERVITIEGWPEYHERAKRTHGHLTNIDFRLGDSRVQLPKVLKQIEKPSMIWLDAHYLGNSMLSAGTPGECPLMDELKAINACSMRHYILIDDLHCFMGELNAGSQRDLWPTLDEIKALVLKGFPDYYITTYQDVIVAVPPEAKEIVHGQPDIKFAVATSNNYLHALPAFAYLFNKSIGQYQATILRYEIRPPKMPPNIGNIAVGPMADYTWCSALKAFLQHWQFDHLVLLLEDYWITAADVKQLGVLWEYAGKHPEVMKIDLSGDRAKYPHEGYYNYADGMKLIRSDDKAEYRGSLQAAIWRKDYLEKHLNSDWNAWQFEKHGCNDGGLILGTQTPVIEYINAVGGEGKQPEIYDHKKIPGWLWQELLAENVVCHR